MALIAVLIGVVGVNRSMMLGAMLDSTYNDNLVPVAMFGESKFQLDEHYRRLYVAMLEPDTTERGNQLQRMLDTERKVTVAVEADKQTVTTAHERDLLGQFDAAWPVYLNSAHKVPSCCATTKKGRGLHHHPQRNPSAI